MMQLARGGLHCLQNSARLPEGVPGTRPSCPQGESLGFDTDSAVDELLGVSALEVPRSGVSYSDLPGRAGTQQGLRCSWCP